MIEPQQIGSVWNSIDAGESGGLFQVLFGLHKCIGISKILSGYKAPTCGEHVDSLAATENPLWKRVET